MDVNFWIRFISYEIVIESRLEIGSLLVQRVLFTEKIERVERYLNREAWTSCVQVSRRRACLKAKADGADLCQACEKSVSSCCRHRRFILSQPTNSPTAVGNQISTKVEKRKKRKMRRIAGENDEVKKETAKSNIQLHHPNLFRFISLGSIGQQ